MRGRKPKPTALKKLHGNPGKRALPKNEPVATGTLHDPPAHLTEDQREAWRYVMQWAPPGVLARIDKGILTAWVVAETIHAEATRRQAATGGLVYKPKGSEIFVPSPYLAIINAQAKLMAKLASELGFSPASRPRIRAPGDDDPIPPPRADAESQGASLTGFLAANPARRH